MSGFTKSVLKARFGREQNLADLDVLITFGHAIDFDILKGQETWHQVMLLQRKDP